MKATILKLRASARIAGLAASALLAGSLAHAQGPGEAERGSGDGAGGTITVTGQRDRNQAVRTFVAKVTEPAGDQIARLSSDLCIATFGLPRAHGSVVARRIEAVARRAGVHAAGPGCRTNVVIAFAEDGEEFLKSLRRGRRSFFLGLELPEVRRLLAGAGPVWAWQTVSLRGSDGRPIEKLSYLNMGGSIMFLGKDSHLLQGTNLTSRFQKETQQALAVSFLVFDVDALEGLTLTQIADYAAMRVLARTRPDSVPGSSTILNLFVPHPARAAPAELTSWDAAYLKALYATSHSLAARRQQSEMARVIRNELDRPDQGEAQ
ncbi:MAG TPA: hypothetical protein VGW34_14850 [Allosphingosinicella sp.]|nr:hypothetical protein [Allosphingosinicella sp.]